MYVGWYSGWWQWWHSRCAANWYQNTCDSKNFIVSKGVWVYPCHIHAGYSNKPVLYSYHTNIHISKDSTLLYGYRLITSSYIHSYLHVASCRPSTPTGSQTRLAGCKQVSLLYWQYWRFNLPRYYTVIYCIVLYYTSMLCCVRWILQ